MCHFNGGKTQREREQKNEIEIKIVEMKHTHIQSAHVWNFSQTLFFLIMPKHTFIRCTLNSTNVLRGLILCFFSALAWLAIVSWCDSQIIGSSFFSLFYIGSFSFFFSRHNQTSAICITVRNVHCTIALFAHNRKKTSENSAKKSQKPIQSCGI